MFEWLSDNWEGIALCCFILSTAWSEYLAWSNSKSNAIHELFFNIIKKLSGRE